MDYIDNRYYKIYNTLVSRARGRLEPIGYEKHHIIPKSLGGTNSPDNLIHFTTKEHRIAHKLIIRFIVCDNKKVLRGLKKAINCFKNNPNR
jgi:hypothetical protein